MKTDTRLLMYVDKQRFSPVFFNMQCSTVFFSSFFVLITLWHVLSFSHNFQKTFIKVKKVSGFAIVRKSILLLKRWGQGGMVSFCVPGGGEQTTKKEKTCKSPGVVPRGWLQANFNHVLPPSFYSKIFISLTQQFTCAHGRLYSSSK